MRYLLMMHAPRGAEAASTAPWTVEELEAHTAFMHRLDDELAATGELVSAEGLASPRLARVVQAGEDGVPAVTDGPFPEAKEFLAGFWIVDVDRPERAYEIAARTSAAPGPGGKPLRVPIEVREVMSASLQECRGIGAAYLDG